MSSERGKSIVSPIHKSYCSTVPRPASILDLMESDSFCWKCLFILLFSRIYFFQIHFFKELWKVMVWVLTIFNDGIYKTLKSMFHSALNYV